MSATYTAGDLFFVHGSDLSSRLIQRGTNSHWCHVALIVSPQGDLIEALGAGVARSSISNYAGSETLVVATQLTAAAAALAVAYATRRVGERYDQLQIVGIALGRLTGGKLLLGVDGTEICSGLCASALENAGVDFGREPAALAPGDLARFFHAAQP